MEDGRDEKVRWLLVISPPEDSSGVGTSGEDLTRDRD